MTLPKKSNKAPITDSKKMEIWNLPDKKFKIITLKKVNEMQENKSN